MKTKIKFLYAFLLLCAACNPEQEQQKKEVIQQHVVVPEGERSFLIRAADDHAFVMQLGRYASGKASDQRLKDYGRFTMEYHKATLNEIQAMATARQITLHDTLNTPDLRLVQLMARKAGNRFDSSYMAIIIQQEKKMINDNDQMAKENAGEPLKAFATRQRDSILTHLDRIITLKDSINIKKETR